MSYNIKYLCHSWFQLPTLKKKTLKYCFVHKFEKIACLGSLVLVLKTAQKVYNEIGFGLCLKSPIYTMT